MGGEGRKLYLNNNEKNVKKNSCGTPVEIALNAWADGFCKL